MRRESDSSDFLFLKPRSAHQPLCEIRLLTQIEHSDGIQISAGGLDFQTELADAENCQVKPGKNGRLSDAEYL